MKKRKTNKAKRFSNSCRNNGTCEHCKENRTYQAVKGIKRTSKEINEFMKTTSSEYPKGYCPVYDADYDTKTNEWKSELCSEKECNYCSTRPIKHSVHCGETHGNI